MIGVIIYSFVDIVPIIGTSKSYSELIITTLDCLKFFFKSPITIIMGFLYVIGYIISYISTTLLCAIGTSNYAQLTNTASNPITIICFAIASLISTTFIRRKITLIEFLFQIPSSFLASYAIYIFKKK